MRGEQFGLHSQETEAAKKIGPFMPGGFFLYRTDEPGELLCVNDALCRIFGCDSEADFRALTGFALNGMVHPDDSAAVFSQSGIDGAEFRIIRKDGTVRWVCLYGSDACTPAESGIRCAFLADVTEKRIRQEQAQQIALKEKLQDEQNRREQMDRMITALASDYRSVYHIDLDPDDGVCYRADPLDAEQTKEGIHFPYVERFTWYAEHSVDEKYRPDFLKFIDPENIRRGLAQKKILVYRYLVHRCGMDYYEMIRIAGVRHAADRDDNIVHAVGLGLTDIDEEFRKAMVRNQALSEALRVAEAANKAKTAFLSNMSHEIRI